MTKEERREYDKKRYSEKREAILAQKKKVCPKRKRMYNRRSRAKKLGLKVDEISVYTSFIGEGDVKGLKKGVEQNIVNLKNNISRLLLTTDIDLGNIIDKIKLLETEIERGLK